MANYFFCALLNHDPAPRLLGIEVASTFHIPSFQIVGLASQEVSEARERIRAAIESSGFEFPRRRVVLNLSPASVRKQGTGLDLAMALAVLQGEEARSPQASLCAAWAELGLDGRLKSPGQAFRALYSAWEAGASHLLVSRDQKEAVRDALQWIDASEILSDRPAPRVLTGETLEQARQWASGQEDALTEITVGTDRSAPRSNAIADPDRDAEMAGLLPLSPLLSRALGLAASGGHHLLLIGPRGTGKTQALNWLAALQPRSNAATAVRHVLLEELRKAEVVATDSAPIRRVGMQVRPAALIGSVRSGMIVPGEFTLADGGLLIADELAEWPRDSRESLRDPLERGRVSITRAQGKLDLPARFQLGSTANFCPCGGWPSELQPVDARGAVPCRCTRAARSNYLSRLSGPVLDRVDVVLRLWAPSAPSAPRRVGEELAELRHRVGVARDRARNIWGDVPGALPAARVEEILKTLHHEGELAPGAAPASLRSRHKLARVALSLAAWEGIDRPEPQHWQEAASYRPEALGLV